MGGIPPFAGFLGKYYLFLAVLHAELYILGFMGLLVSAASMFVYLKIIKVDIFEVPLNSKLVYLNTNSKLPVLIINFGLIYLAA
jgi:NADH-quinone oxidoreductase subunit N